MFSTCIFFLFSRSYASLPLRKLKTLVNNSRLGCFSALVREVRVQRLTGMFFFFFDCFFLLTYTVGWHERKVFLFFSVGPPFF